MRLLKLLFGGKKHLNEGSRELADLVKLNTVIEDQ